MFKSARILALALLLGIGGAQVAAQSGPILLENGTTSNDVPGPIVSFADGTQIMVEPSKGPVQGIIRQRNEVIDAGEIRTHISGFVAIQTSDGWQGAAHTFSFDATGTEFAEAEIEDGWHIVLDKAGD